MSHVIRLSALLVASLTAPLIGQQRSGTASARATTPKARTPVPASDYGKWESLGTGTLSPDGKWVAYDFRRAGGGGELRYRAVASEAEHTAPSGLSLPLTLSGGAAFTSNSRWLLYTVSIDTSVGGRVGTGAKAGAVPPRNRVGIVDLSTGTASLLEDVQSFVLSHDGAHVALRRYPAPGRQSRGADLVIRDLEQATDVTFGDVADFAWNDDGTMLAMTIDVEGKTGNGVQVLNVATGSIRSLDAGETQYSSVQWRAHSDDLAAFRSRADSAFADTSYAVIAWRGVGTRSTKEVYDFASDHAFPAGMRVASYRALQWSDDGSTLFFGIAPREAKPIPPPTDQRATTPRPARVEVWHWKDLREYHQQDREGQQDRQKTHLVAWHPGLRTLVRLADDSLDTIQLSENRQGAIATDERPYFKEAISGRQYRDVYRVDITTGKRDKVITKSAYGGSMSPNGGYILYAQGGHWWARNLATGASANLTGRIGSTFVNMEDDHPVPERRPYGVAGWTTGEKSVILYDRFDLWQVTPDGTNPVRLTKGKEDSTVYRYVRVDPEARTIDPGKPMFVAATGEWTKRSGYARLVIGEPVQRLVWFDKAVSRLQKAKDADVFLFEEQTYEESPNFFVGSAALGDAKQVSHTNSFQSDYAWGRQELRSYTNTHGDKLQMMLTYPADYKPGTKYPMVVYYYEKLSQGFHQYIVPSERSTYNTTVFSQNGYFVLRPDIQFRARDPGYSGLDCVLAAVKAALATGMVDPKRVGNMGHSWGGYQSAFYAVHGKGVFAATVAGAPLTDLISMYGYTSFNTGLPETGHYETSQERMQVPLWDDPQAYIRNSTVFAIDSLQTPLLLEEGDADGNVNPWQSMELYNFGRRLGKHVVYLIYNDENHGVARPESQMDYHRRQLEWFGHFLKGEPAAGWITNGETYLARQKLLKDAAAASADVAAGTQPVSASAAGTRGVRVVPP